LQLSKLFFLFAVSVQLYSPRRPAVDVAEVFLWLMAVLTILCASYWSAWRAREASVEQDKLLKVSFYNSYRISLSWTHFCSLKIILLILVLTVILIYRMLRMISQTLKMRALVEL
jgi:heme/copper-type cytochrome/quinol oxidase subunit 2